jgi:hypothetical protein
VRLLKAQQRKARWLTSSDGRNPPKGSPPKSFGRARWPEATQHAHDAVCRVRPRPRVVGLAAGIGSEHRLRLLDPGAAAQIRTTGPETASRIQTGP